MPDGPIGFSRCPFQQAHQPFADSLDTALFKEIGAVFNRAFDSLGRAVRGAPFSQFKGKIEPGGIEVDRFEAGDDPGQLHSGF